MIFRFNSSSKNFTDFQNFTVQSAFAVIGGDSHPACPKDRAVAGVREVDIQTRKSKTRYVWPNIYELQTQL